MEIVKRLDVRLAKPSAVTVGKFDGIHKGHRKLINRALSYKQSGCAAALFTFDIEKSGKKYIYTAEEKRDIVASCGIDVMAEHPFDESLTRMRPEDFFTEILIGKMNARAVIAGEDFRFGYNRQGDTALLEKLCREYGVVLEVVKKERYLGREIASTVVREELLGGRMESANAMLGAPYMIRGTVQGGRQLGRTLGMPTANIAIPPEKIIPPNGVYASFTKYKDKIYKSVTNIGVKPTIEGRRKIGAETYILGFNESIYGEEISIGLLGFRRREAKFDSVKDLEKQMHLDKKDALDYLDGYDF